jgi:7-cyano-7-deazaguanine synthase
VINHKIGDFQMRHDSIVLLSGGIDSAVTATIETKKGANPIGLFIHYGQRHATEYMGAIDVARQLNIKLRRIDIPIGDMLKSSLLDPKTAVPEAGHNDAIPSTYVPGRNTFLIALALSVAESVGAGRAVIGANILDYSGYPDCRPEYIAAYNQLARLSSKAAVSGNPIAIDAPLISMTKAEIITAGHGAGLDFSKTISCYSPTYEKSCGICDACAIRIRGFREAGIEDPTPYIKGA